MCTQSRDGVCLFLPEPELYVSSAHQKFDQDGNLQDDETRRRIRALLDALVAWTRRVGSE